MEQERRREIYLDCAASTPCDPAVVEAMMPFLLHEFANPSSIHRAGARAASAIDDARAKLAEAIGALPEELVFTAGATESNNLALLGSAEAHPSGRRKVVTIPIEHKSVLEPCDRLARRGYQVVLCPVRRDGQVELGALAELLDGETLLVSIQAANNEVGTIQPVLEVAQLAHRVGALVHCDAAQALGKVPLDVDSWDVDLLSVSGHKCYGPKGVGALYLRGGIRAGVVAPICLGGGQEGGLRSGTHNVAAIVGIAEAARLSVEKMPTEGIWLAQLRDRLEEVLCSELPGVRRNGALQRRLPGITSLTIPSVDAEAIISNAPDLALSSSSACNSGAPEPSHVLLALGLSRAEAFATIRIGVGRFNCQSEVEYAAKRIVNVVKCLRERSGVVWPTEVGARM
jgi:cysteine desulfurase